MRSENVSPDWRTGSWYSICTSTVSPGPMLATELVKMFGRSCSMSAALWPAALACS